MLENITDPKLSFSQFIDSLTRSTPIEWKEDSFKLENWLGRLLRWIIPGYAQRKDCIVADQLARLILRQDAPFLINHDFLKMCEIVYKKQLTSSYFPSKSLIKANKQMKTLIVMMKISLQFNIPIDVLEQNLDFVQFVEINHLHRRFDSSYHKRGFGITIENGQICLKYLNPTLPSEPLSKPWFHLQMDASKRINGMDLFAYGWESSFPPSLKPIKIIDSSLAPMSGVDHCIELNTTLPTYKIWDIHSAPLGHSYIKIYEPLLEEGRPTNKVAVYIVGYGFQTIAVPDIVEFADREKVMTAEKLSLDQFNHCKKVIENLLLYQRDPKLVSSMEREKIKDLYSEFYHTTCVNFATSMMHMAKGIKLNGRLSIIKMLLPDINSKFFDSLRSKAPRFSKGIINIIEFIIRGHFPISLISEQEKWNKRQIASSL